ncbi:3-isopropylmalate dehydrogenase [Pseudalkalibacillus berkeleyi]|uniref:3-isopropylmalate dehydrogenase n=1 Tax=Pseudalkalibacillus berkeleyi TaxID=1069813 RepID=A0ABS9H6B6_9BACL|nr:3-isopropylmalate dehydrogenase [Pseudalkalibacillus berkeleyi]MCF6139515.1 3-isopropylmalate dehydrogenase [Pseudalkalibacillus berkeleyi]
MKKQVAVLPGDGIGQEVLNGALDVLKAVEDQYGHEFEIVQGKIGGAAIDHHGTPLPRETLDLCKQSDAVLLGAVGGPKWEDNPVDLRPEKGLLGLRKELGLFANFRPVKTFESLQDASPMKPSVVKDVDFVIVRELTSGLYFGEPRERRGKNREIAVDTLQYEKKEIEKVVHKAFQLASERRKKLTSVDKANVLESSRMWREVVNEVATEYPTVEVEHLLVDAAAMKLVYQPKQFDVIVTENMFGDILSDEASMLTGSLGMLPSASLREDTFGVYEPVHGSAPDIAGRNLANPLGMIQSVAMMLRHSFGLHEEAEMIDQAINEVLKAGYRTGDLSGHEKIHPVVKTDEMSDFVVEHFTPNYAISGILAAYM